MQMLLLFYLGGIIELKNHYFIMYKIRVFLFCCAMLFVLGLRAQSDVTMPAYIFDPKLQASAEMILAKPEREFSDSVMKQYVDSLMLRDSIITAMKKAEAKHSIKGIIRDFNTGEGIPFAQVIFPRTGIGAIAELDGSFQLIFENNIADSVAIGALGYKSQLRKIDTNNRDIVLDIELSREDNLLREVIIRPGEDPAITLIKKIIENKPKNNPDKYENYSYELYNKLELDLVRMTREQFRKIPMMKPFSFIFDNVDSMSEAKPFLPVYLTETLSDYYFQRSPKKTKETIKASQVKGINNESVTQFLGGMYQQINMYDNFIDIFDKQFTSPISNNAPFYYKYKIVDTQVAYGHQIILVQFAPKRSAENLFEGDLWVVDSVFALQRMSLDISKDANINLVNRVSLYQEFAPVGDSVWFNIKDKFIADFTVPYGGKKMPGFIGRKTTSYRNVLLNNSSVSDFVNDKKRKQDVTVVDGAQDKGSNFWAENRHDSLNKNEQAIYSMIDTLNAMPIFNRTKNIIKFLAKGTQDIGKIELGPYWSVYNYNPIEGHRFRFTMGTNPKLFKNLYLNGYLAYGTFDERFKYKVSGLWLLNRQPRQRIYASYTSDLDRSISYYSEAATDNFLSNAIRKKYVPFKLAFVKDFRFEHYKEYFNGFSHEETFIHKDFNPYAPLPSTTIFKNPDGTLSNNVINTEVGIKFRFAYKEKFLEGDYYRLSLGSRYPIVSLQMSFGLKGILNSGYEYQKIRLNISDVFKVPHLGTFTYNVFAGKVLGTLPYPLLEIHPGNDFYYYSPYAFSMMSRFEFLSDQYAGLMFEHNIGGGIFNYIPFIKKAKLRQFWTAKTAIGNLSSSNQLLNLDKGFKFNTLKGSQYIELGTGIDNIFQLFRIDFVWRVTPSPLPGEPIEKRFGIFGSFKVGF